MEEHINHIQGIYCIKYKLNIIYIGQSVNINARFKQHLRALNRKKHHNFILQRMFDKNKSDFSFEIIEKLNDKNSLTTREQFWIDKYKTINISKANGSHVHSEKSKFKMSEYAKNRTEEHKDNLKKALKGKPSTRKGITGVFKHSDVSKIKIGKASVGNKYCLGLKHSKETKKKLSELRIDNINTKLVLDLQMGIFYVSLTRACEALNIDYKLTSNRLRGRTKNDTNLIYI